MAVQKKGTSVPALKSRFGYQSMKLRVATSIGFFATGGVGLISSLADVVKTAQVSPVKDVTISTLEHLRYTIFEPSLPGAVGDSIGMGAISGAIVGVGIVHMLRGWKSVILPFPPALAAGGAAVISLIFGGITYAGGVDGDPAARIEQGWTQQNFSISRELPDPVSDYNSNAGRDEWYPAAFSISKTANDGLVPGAESTTSEAKEHYYLVEPVLNANGDRIGNNVKQVDAATAQKAQDLYTQHSSSMSRR